MGSATSASASQRKMILAFVAGVLAVLVFHQIAASLVNWCVQWNLIPPFSVPQVVNQQVINQQVINQQVINQQVINQSFRGGVWILVFAWLAPRFPKGVSWWVTAFAFRGDPAAAGELVRRAVH